MTEEHKHRYKPRSPAVLHRTEFRGVNDKFAVWLTQHVGTMWTAYIFTIICMVGLLAILGFLPSILVLVILWMTSEFLSLTLLPIIMVGQNILGRKSELQAEEAYKATMEDFNDTEEMLRILKQLAEAHGL